MDVDGVELHLPRGGAAGIDRVQRRAGPRDEVVAMVDGARDLHTGLVAHRNVGVVTQEDIARRKARVVRLFGAKMLDQ